MMLTLHGCMQGGWCMGSTAAFGLHLALLAWAAAGEVQVRLVSLQCTEHVEIHAVFHVLYQYNF